MTDPYDDTPEFEHGPSAGEEAVATTIRARLAQHRRAIAPQDRKPIELDVPGYDGDLVAVYGYRTLAEAQKGAAKIQKIKDPALQMKIASADLLVNCLDELCIRVDGKLKPLGSDGSSLRWDPEAIEELGGNAKELGLDSARKVCIWIFGDEWQLIQQAQEVSSYLTDGEDGDDVLSGIVGKSQDSRKASS